MIAFVETDTSRSTVSSAAAAAAAVVADGRCIQRIQVVQIVTVARSSASQWRSSYGPPVFQRWAKKEREASVIFTTFPRQCTQHTVRK